MTVAKARPVQPAAPEAPADVDSSVIDSLLGVETGQFMINDYGYGHSNAKSFEAFDEATLQGLGLSKNPLEILRTIHSFDPCLACAVHVMDGKGTEIVKVRIL